MRFINCAFPTPARAVEFADHSMEMISYYAIRLQQLAAERAYQTYEGSKWDRGLLPIDTIDLLEQERGGHLTLDRSSQMDRAPVRESIAKHGVRNGNTMAIAPTATIANIMSKSSSRPTASTPRRIFPEISSWSTSTRDPARNAACGMTLVQDLKYHDGSVLEIDRVPDDLKDVFEPRSRLIQMADRLRGPSPKSGSIWANPEPIL